MINRNLIGMLVGLSIIIVMVIPGSLAITPDNSFKNEIFNIITIEEKNQPMPNSFVDDIIRFDDGIPIGGVGRTGGGTLEGAIRITPEELVEYDGWNLTGVIFYHNAEGTHSGLVKIYDEMSEQWPGEIIIQEPYTVTGKDWKRISLSEPVALDIDRDIWVSVEITHELGEIPLGIDQGPAVPHKGAYFTYPGISWYELPRANIDSNWNLGGIVSNGKQAFSISNIQGLVGVSADIENIAPWNMVDVEWKISISGGLLGRINTTTEGVIPRIVVGETRTVESDPCFGFGPVRISVSVHSAASSVVSKDATGIVFLNFLFNVKE